MRYCQYGCDNKDYYCYNKFRTMRASFLLKVDLVTVTININGKIFIQTFHCCSSFHLFCPYSTCKRTSHQKSHQEDGVEYRIFTLAQIRLPSQGKSHRFLPSCSSFHALRIATNRVEYRATVRCRARTKSTGAARRTSITSMPFAKMQTNLEVFMRALHTSLAIITDSLSLFKHSFGYRDSHGRVYIANTI